MTVHMLRETLFWCTVINFSVHLVWFLFFSFAHDWMYKFHGKWFNMPAERFDSIHYTGMTFYKICILVFNLVPYAALSIAAR